MTKQSGSSKPSPSRAERAAAWWRQLSGHGDNDDADQARQKTDTGALARLRRCADPIEAAAEPAFIDLFRRLYPKGKAHKERLEGVAVAAILLAHLRSEPRAAIHLPVRLGRTREGKIPKNDDVAVFSASRMRSLVRAQSPSEVLRGFRNAIAILGADNVPPGELAHYALYWLHPQHGEKARIKFLFDYHQAGDAAPDTETTDAPTGETLS